MADDIANGGIEITGDSFVVGSTLSYTCQNGFATDDATLTACSNSFDWSLDDFPPTCNPGKHYHINLMQECFHT